MPLRELICDYKGKITSIKVLPFASSGYEAEYEVTQLSELSGRLSATGVGSNYVRLHSDGTSTTRFYGVFTTGEGERVLVESAGMSVPLAPGRVRFGTTVTFKTRSEKLGWLNMTMGAFEGEGDFSTMEIVGKIYEWK